MVLSIVPPRPSGTSRTSKAIMHRTARRWPLVVESMAGSATLVVTVIRRHGAIGI